jgi:inosose dehydratase
VRIQSAIRLATGPVTWGVDFADAPENPPWRRVLDEIASSDLDALELGPVGYLPEDAEMLARELSSRGLTAVGSFVFEDLHDPGRRAEILATARRTCRMIAAGGGGILVIIDRPGPERAATAGRSHAARRLGDRGWSAMVDTINGVAEVARDHGLEPTVHPHAGGYVEFMDEIDRLLDTCELALCLDTGHLAYAGADPAAALATYGDRIAHLHLKDVDGEVLARGQRDRLGFWDAVAAGVFCPLGTGTVDLEAVGAALERSAYVGFATIEQDRAPGSGTPADDLRRCVTAARAAGIGERLTPAAVKAPRA